MSDDERRAIEVKLDLLLAMVEEIKTDRKECRQHCDSEMPRVHRRIDEVKEKVDKMSGAAEQRRASALTRPHWVKIGWAVAAGLGAGIGFLLRGGVQW